MKTKRLRLTGLIFQLAVFVGFMMKAFIINDWIGFGIFLFGLLMTIFFIDRTAKL